MKALVFVLILVLLLSSSISAKNVTTNFAGKTTTRIMPSVPIEEQIASYSLKQYKEKVYSTTFKVIALRICDSNE